MGKRQVNTGWSVLVLLAVATAAAGDVAPFTVTTRRADDRVSVSVEKGNATLSVHSPFGISHAILQQTNSKWPDSVVLRLHLKGLEHVRITNGRVTLEASASLRDAKPLVRVWKDGKEDAPLDATSSFWMKVRILAADGSAAKAMPLENGYFELHPPRALFEGNPSSITVHWIDFYRY